MRIVDWGEVPYEESVQRQLALVDEVASGAEDVLVFCSHPAVVTIGRGTKPEDVVDWKGETVTTSRGGRATYHGPNQIVIYPIVNLTRERKQVPVRDVHSFLRALERAVVEGLSQLGLIAEVRDVKPDKDSPSLTGVWVGERKIASIGIAVKKWVTYHGVAVNVYHDPTAFRGINPCGFSSRIMTSVEDELGKKVPGTFLQDAISTAFISYLS